MTDEQVKEQQSRVEVVYARWAEHCLAGWLSSHTWHDDGTAGKGYENSTARTSVRWQYLAVHFEWNLQVISTLEDYELDRIVRHEICHAIVAEMREWCEGEEAETAHVTRAMKHEERTVSQLSAILKWVHSAGIEAGKAELRGNLE